MCALRCGASNGCLCAGPTGSFGAASSALRMSLMGRYGELCGRRRRCPRPGVLRRWPAPAGRSAACRRVCPAALGSSRHAPVRPGPWAGALLPSGASLAQAMAAPVDPGRGLVIELGVGTGAITRALIARGVRPEQLILVEKDPALFGEMARRFPGVVALQGVAAHLGRLLSRAGAGRPGTLVSSLPLLSMRRRQRLRVLIQMFSSLGGGRHAGPIHLLPAAADSGCACRRAGGSGHAGRPSFLKPSTCRHLGLSGLPSTFKRRQEQDELRLNQAVRPRKQPHKRPHGLAKRSGQADGTPKAAKWTTHSRSGSMATSAAASAS